MANLAENRKAVFDYEILEKFEAGIVLQGFEVKSIRLGRMNLAGAYVVPRNEEFFLVGATVPPYQPKNTPLNYDPKRSKKLLLKKSEIKYIIGKSQERGLTLIPLRVYTGKRKIKIEFGLARGRKAINKKELIKKRDARREIERELKSRG